DESDGTRSAVYGKVQPGGRGLRTHRLVDTLWRVASESDGLLRIPRPIAFIREYGLLLESAVPGEPVKGDRQSRAFRGVGRAAAEAVAVIHESGLEPDERIHIESELDRLDAVTEQFAYVNPKAHFLLSELLVHLRDRLERTGEEELVPTHADLKYDQFIHQDGLYTLIDFDYCAMAETSYDLAKFCAYVVPSAPTGWEADLHLFTPPEPGCRRLRRRLPRLRAPTCCPGSPVRWSSSRCARPPFPRSTPGPTPR